MVTVNPFVDIQVTLVPGSCDAARLAAGLV
jgi:hypothetical protein